MAIPKYDELFNPVLQAMHDLGGSGGVNEIDDKVQEILNLPEKEANAIHKGNSTVVSYRAAWARNYLKRYGLLENSERGVWSLTQKGLRTNSVDPVAVKKYVKQNLDSVGVVDRDEHTDASIVEWEDSLLAILITIPPVAFERLCQRVLREAGFTEVAVEGKSGDGGIDGRGIYKLNGLISIRAIFQAKRYKGAISSQQIREFKGTMTGRAEKGLFITTGTFTREAKKEAVRDGSPPIDLIDGKALANILKDLRLGIVVKTVEEVEVTKDWYAQL